MLFRSSPDNGTGRYLYCTDEMFWAFYLGTGYWEARMQIGSRFSLEFIDCTVYDISSTDVWSQRYPSEVAVVSGGGEVHKETVNILDGTFARKILPFSTITQCLATYNVPIQIPVFAGQTVTVKLSLKRNTSGTFSSHDGRKASIIEPGIHLEGLGILSNTYASLYDTWEELEVSGTSQEDGIILFYVSGGVNAHTLLAKEEELDPYIWYSYTNSDEPGLYCPPPKFNSSSHSIPSFPDYAALKTYTEGVGFYDVFGVTIYADGLEIVKS